MPAEPVNPQPDLDSTLQALAAARAQLLALRTTLDGLGTALGLPTAQAAPDHCTAAVALLERQLAALPLAPAPQDPGQ